tara:strand:- start:122 stop:391 length:270 start_codon:yes stop_codon:yes gene_type:complete
MAAPIASLLIRTAKAVKNAKNAKDKAKAQKRLNKLKIKYKNSKGTDVSDIDEMYQLRAKVNPEKFKDKNSQAYLKWLKDNKKGIHKGKK